MDLIYANNLRQDIGVLLNFTLDYEESNEANECTFEIKMPLIKNQLSLGDYFYTEDGEELGGIVDAQEINTNNQIVTSTGRTWRGILGSKILEPLAGDDYLTLTGDLNDIISQLITSIGLDDVFSVSENETITKTFRFDRYVDAYSGIIKLLKTFDYKLKISWDTHNHITLLEAVPMTDFSNESEISSDLFDFKIKKTALSVNHMIGLGSGQLSERQVVNKYVQADGSIGNEPYFTGSNEIVEVYDYSNAESLEDLEEKTIEQLMSKSVKDSLEVKNKGNLNADIGDLITATDINTGISVTQYVTNKIITIKNDVIAIDYEIGDKII